MNSLSKSKLTRVRGITLVELLIVVVIIAIVAAFGYPNYLKQAHKAGRTDATSALLAIAAAQEKEFLKNNAYTANLADLGITETEAGKYTLSLSLPEGGGFLASAAPPGTNGNTSQVGDKDCTEFSIDHTGAKRSKGSASNDDGTVTEFSSSCW